MCVCVMKGDWSAFEHTITPLESGGRNTSFLGLTRRNCGNEARTSRSYSSSASDDWKQRSSVPESLLDHIPLSLVNDANSGGRPLFRTSTSPAVIVIDDDDAAAVKPDYVTRASSQLCANKSCGTVSVQSTDSRLLKDC